MKNLDMAYKKVLEYCANLWYSLIRIQGSSGVKFMKILKKNRISGILDAKELGAYIAHKYMTENGVEISKIKLQKSLYFLFAMWGGMIRKSKNNPEYVEEDFSAQNEYLFSNDIEAWVYGPVVPDVYRMSNLAKYYEDAITKIEANQFLKETINSILDDIFAIADFKLVSISHEDKCWQESFDPSDKVHNNVIDKDSIIEEYATRECI